MTARWFAAAPWRAALSLLAICAGQAPVTPQDVLTFDVAPRTVACAGVSPRRCLLVRRSPSAEWTNFYDPIEGFTYEEGYAYRIEVERRRVPDPPADGSSFHYRLRRTLSRERAPER